MPTWTLLWKPSGAMAALRDIGAHRRWSKPLVIKDEVAFFQAIKARLVKLCPKRSDTV